MALKAPFNYIGNKYRIIDNIKQHFPKNANVFVDLFCGGCDVSINYNADVKYANDINYHVIDIMRQIQNLAIEDILNFIDERIDEWKLSKENKDGYIAYRDYYNKQGAPLDLYVLMCYSFNYQFRFNSRHEYNNPFGKDRSSFNQRMRTNLIQFKTCINDLIFSSDNFVEFNYDVLKEGDFIYADPPYALTCGSYNDGKRGFNGWSDQDDLNLFAILNELSGKGVKFALSNVIEHKGTVNENLANWTNENLYHLHEINVDYNNCNYQSRNKYNVTKEVLITNY